MKMHPALGLALDLLFPILCQGCGQEGLYLCLSCQNRLSVPDQRCCQCAKNALLGQTHEQCQDADEVSLDGLLVASDYEDETVRNLIWNFKYNSIREIARPLSVVLVDFVVKMRLEEFLAESVVVPVPLNPWRAKIRGFNQAELLAQNFSEKLGLTYSPVLERTRYTKRQVDLPKTDRVQNIKGAFALSGAFRLTGKKIVLIDDVATTSATLNECARVLKSAGAGRVWALVVARN